MTVQQRIRALKLLKYQQAHPEDAKRIGIQVYMIAKDSKIRRT